MCTCPVCLSKQPHSDQVPTAGNGGCDWVVLALYTLALPPIVCFDDDVTIDIYSRIFISKALVLVGGVSFILSQCIIVVKFAITEMLLDPRTATEARVHHVQSIRWLLYPRAQILVWLTASTVVVAPILHLLLFLPDTFTSNDLINGVHPVTQTLNIISSLEVAAMTIISWGLTRKISLVVDNFGLRATYLSISKYSAICLTGYGLTSLLPLLGVAEFLDEFYATTMIVMHGSQALCFMLITMPLRQSYLTVFYRYLSTSEGYAAVLTFCRMELAPELLLAWHEVEKFKRGEVTVDYIYAKVLDLHSELFQVDLADEVRNIAVSFRSWKNKVDVLLQPGDIAAARAGVVEAAKLASFVPAPARPSESRPLYDATFFHPLSAELLRLLYLHVLPRFEEFPQSSDWIVFRNGEKAMVSLDAVDNMVRKTVVVSRPLASMTPNIEDIPHGRRMLAMPQEELR
ncbi:hypothetical protein DYB25_004462 [Aphanomyces astaci]|uniref:RGS domain-containing protein n=1 Tax=Aphanomyces astaci TaxID=112090 RepID=A0A397BRZ2_APHAT|nr:hypothetical protein DYB25_004462 [Aphanomyces astaci]RHY67637.1 hypothetical protein DYB30_002856 [Aphanomyces astaci]RHY80010.1 hypothetical protein DYB31_003766 [Aphanomyces astaci]